MNLNFRKCILTNKIKSKSNLIRIVKTKNNKYFINSDKHGKGAYISKDAKNLNIIFKKRLLNKAFKSNVPIKIYEELIKLLKGG